MNLRTTFGTRFEFRTLSRLMIEMIHLACSSLQSHRRVCSTMLRHRLRVRSSTLNRITARSESAHSIAAHPLKVFYRRTLKNALILAWLGCLTGCGSTLSRGETSDERPSPDLLAHWPVPGTVTVRLLNETSVPIYRAQATLDGEPIDMAPDDQVLNFQVEEGEHELDLDFVLRRFGPAIMTTFPHFDTRARGSTSFELGPGCSAEIEAMIENNLQIGVQPYIWFERRLHCPNQGQSAPTDELITNL